MIIMLNYVLNRRINFKFEKKTPIQQIPSEVMSTSAPQTHPLQFVSDHSIDSRIKSDESLAREVQRTISLTSENPSETFFSADEDMHSSSLRTSINDRVNQKKRFASDLRYE